MLPNGQGARLLRFILLGAALAIAVVVALRSPGAKPPAVRVAEQHLETAEVEREVAAAHAVTIAARAADARAANRPALASAESFAKRVKVERAGQLRVQGAGESVPTLVSVPPLVTERIEADSVAIRALSLALTLDTQAAAAREEQLAADAKVRDAARLTITQLQHERSPRCGRRCGMVLGAASLLALEIAIDQSHRLVHP